MTKPTVTHALAFTIGDGTYAWPVCTGRGGPWHVRSGRFADDPDQVTCRRCLTRPSR